MTLPTFSTILLSLALVAFIYLLAFGILFFSASLRFIQLTWLGKKPAPETLPLGTDAPAITVFVPARNEGDSLIDTVLSLIHQDYAGFLRVQLLVHDRSDTSTAPLFQHFNATDDLNLNECVLHRDERREVVIQFCDTSPKRDKLNIALDALKTPIVAFLDADHRASTEWISTSLAVLQKTGAQAVQSRRMPLAAQSVFQLWDSVQNHIGNEVLNTILEGNGRNVFFTGTTCVFESKVFDQLRFPDCITEDTYLSYEMISRGDQIAYNPVIGSYEEVAPNLKSYVARRRRWSSGHTQTWAEHLKKISNSSLAKMEKLQLYIHGQFYIVPVIALFLLNATSLFLFLQFTRNIQMLVFLFTTVIAFLLGKALSRQYRNLFIDSVVSFFMMFPQIVVLALLFYRFFTHELYYYLLAFPYAEKISLYQLGLIFIPFTVVIVGYIRYRNIRPIQLINLFLSYPFFLFLDMYAAVLGFFDFVFKRNIWAQVHRVNLVQTHGLPSALLGVLRQAQVKNFRSLWYWTIPAFLLLGVITNEFMTFHNCGEPVSFLWSPILYHEKPPATLDLSFQKVGINADQFRLTVHAQVKSEKPKIFHLEEVVDGERIRTEDFTGSPDGKDVFFEMTLPYGWERKKLKINLFSERIYCERNRDLSTEVKEIKGKQLFVNGEPFLIKGVVPSFSFASLNLAIQTGYEQIKDLGANVIRFYHLPSVEAIETAEKNGLMIIDQPDQSTWTNLSVDSSIDRYLLMRRFRELQKKLEGNPYSLFHNFGNELEAGKNREQSIETLKGIIQEARNETVNYSSQTPLGYATYLTYVPYPSDVLGVNMLDTGETYWSKALKLLQNSPQPFYASEFGGFLAHFERPSVYQRIERMRWQWNLILSSGAMGAVFFESHDNWAQPVMTGYNDPFSPEMPDDQRGIWDEKNHPKKELPFVEALFSDFRIEADHQTITAQDSELSVKISNIRPYRLQNVSLANSFGPAQELGSFEPNETKNLLLKIAPGVASQFEFTANYTTHHGLKSKSKIHLTVPRVTTIPVVLNEDFISDDATQAADGAQGRLLWSNTAKMVLPESWKTFSFNGKPHSRSSSVMEFPVEKTRTLINDLLVKDGEKWIPFDSSRIGDGRYVFRFKVDEALAKGGSLILSGVGASEVSIKASLNGTASKFDCQPYRECPIDLSHFEFEADRYLYLEVNRNRTIYLTKPEIRIDFERPWFFIPSAVSIHR